jgi:hypothetical protein
VKSRIVTFGIGAFLFLLLTGFAFRDDYPPLPDPLELTVAFDPAVSGRSDPIIIGGTAGAADFIYVRFIDATTAIFGYDSWGNGGPASKAIKLQPGISHQLRIEAPMLGQYWSNSVPASNHLRVAFDGIDVLDADVPFYNRAEDRIFVGWNPIGGTVCGQDLHGVLKDAKGRPLRGSPANLFSLWERVVGCWTYGRWRIWPLFLVSAVVAYGWHTLVRLSWKARVRESDWRRRAWHEHRWFIAMAALCLLSFAYVVTGGSFQFDYPESFGSFYDFQARSILQGHLDVPPEAISGEAFVVGGKYYGYYGLTPALLRMPFVALGLMTNNLSRGFMLLDYAVCLVGSYLLLRQAFRMLGKKDSAIAPWAVVLLTANIGLGSTLFFLSSRAYIYHEAILCAVAFALVSCFFVLRYFAEPEQSWWLGALAGGLLCIQARPSTGLFALSFTGFVAMANIARFWIGRGGTAANSTDRARSAFPCRHLLVGAGCIVAIFSFNAVSYLKFKTFDGSPFKYHIQYDAVRINRIEGRNFHFSNLRFNFDAYLVSATFEFRSKFPFFFYTGRDPAGYRGSINGVSYYPDTNQSAFKAVRMDMAEPMLGLPYAMPGLFLLAVAGTALLYIRDQGLRWLIGSLWAGVIPFAIAMFMAICTAHRYTADFCPFLITGAALGLAAFETESWRIAVRTILAAATLWSIFVSVALTVHYQGAETWGVPDNVRQTYKNLSKQIDHFFEH